MDALTTREQRDINRLSIAAARAQLGERIADLDTRLGTLEGGALPAGSVDNTELATDVKVGSLAALTTTAKSSVQAAVTWCGLATSATCVSMSPCAATALPSAVAASASACVASP